MEVFWNKVYEKWPLLQDAVEGPLMTYLEEAFSFAVEFGYNDGRADEKEDNGYRQQAEEVRIHQRLQEVATQPILQSLEKAVLAEEARIESQLDDLLTGEDT
tara:strand:+ start:285 stop:590 length:306 start_codon:yes stop_codon:yes gene_type:complete